MGKTTQSTTQSSSPPPQVLANYQGLVNRATTVANTPYQQYQGQIVPDLNLSQIDAMAAMSQAGQVAPQYYNQASNYINSAASPNQAISPFAMAGATGAMGAGQGLAGYGVNAGQNIANYGNNAGNNIANYASGIGAAGPQLQQFSAQNLQQYLNPYTQNVIDTTGANIDRSNAIQSNSLTGSAIQAGNAFGGDRAGVAQAELARNQDLAKNQVMAQLQSQGYSQALGQFNTSNQQALAGQQTALGGIGQGAALGLGAQNSGAQLGLNAQQAGGQLGLAGAQLGTSAGQNAQQAQLSAGNAIGNLGSTALQSYLTSANAQLQAGNQQQAQSGANNQAAYQQWLQQQAYPFQTTQFLGNTIMGTGGASGGTSQTTSPGPNVVGQALGLGATALGAFLSDERAKENIQPIGKTFDGQPIYRYNYKGEPATQMGLIAQNVERSHPNAVAEHNGLKYVNYDVATEHAADKGHFAGGGLVPGGIPGMAPDAPGMFQPIDFTKGGIHGYVPDSGQVKASGGVKIPAYPGAPSNTNTPSAGMTGSFASIGKGLGAGSPSYGGDNMITGSYGGSSSNPLDGLSASDYGEGFYTGGLVPAYGAGMRFADGGMSDDPFGDANRAAGYDLLRQGLGSAAPDGIPGGEPPPEPIRMPSPEATAAWRKGVDADISGGLTAPEPTGTTALAQNVSAPRSALPPEITAGVSGAPAPTSSSVSAYAPEGNPGGQAALAAAMAAQAPQAAERPNIGQALMAAGLGMMSSRSPTLLGNVGEGGAQGLANYQRQQEKYNELDAHPIIDHSGPTTRIYYPSTKQWIDTGIPTMTAANKAAHEDVKAQRELTNASAALIRGPDGKMVANPAYLDLKKQEAEINQKDKWAFAGTINNGEVSHPAIMNQATGEIVDGVTKKPPSESDTFQPKGGKAVDTSMVKDIGDGIISGKLPPETSSLYGMAAPVKAYISKSGFDLSKAQLEKKAADKQIASLNGPQMVRFAGLAKSVDSTIDEVRDLSKKMELSGVPKLNAAELAYYIQTQGNTPNGQLATQYQTAVGVLKEEFANLANGGYAPTEPAWKLANEQINGNYGAKQLSSSLDEVQRLIRYRVNAIPGFNTLGPGAGNRYTGQQPTTMGDGSGGHAASPAPSGAKPPTVTQNGHTYNLQPDGSYK